LERPEKIKRLKQDVKHENEVRHGANAYQQQRFAFESRVDDATPPALKHVAFNAIQDSQIS
jgi:hypothetical protein